MTSTFTDDDSQSRVLEEYERFHETLQVLLRAQPTDALDAYDTQGYGGTVSATPIYRTIEFCGSARSLWGKIESGRWDWLGVNTDGAFVLGSPPVPRIHGSGVVESHVRSDAIEGEYSVKIATPDGTSSSDSFPTEAAAREGYEAEGVRLYAGDKPCLYRLRLFVRGSRAEEEYIVSRPSTYNLSPAGRPE